MHEHYGFPEDTLCFKQISCSLPQTMVHSQRHMQKNTPTSFLESLVHQNSDHVWLIDVNMQIICQYVNLLLNNLSEIHDNIPMDYQRWRQNHPFTLQFCHSFLSIWGKETKQQTSIWMAAISKTFHSQQIKMRHTIGIIHSFHSEHKEMRGCWAAGLSKIWLRYCGSLKGSAFTGIPHWSIPGLNEIKVIERHALFVILMHAWWQA